MHVDLAKLSNLIHKRADEIDKSVAGTGYLARTVIGVCIFLLDNEGDIDLLSAKQKLTFERFLRPLLDDGISDGKPDRAKAGSMVHKQA
jgi:hypothetical protein